MAGGYLGSTGGGGSGNTGDVGKRIQFFSADSF